MLAMSDETVKQMDVGCECTEYMIKMRSAIFLLVIHFPQRISKCILHNVESYTRSKCTLARRCHVSRLNLPVSTGSSTYECKHRAAVRFTEQPIHCPIHHKYAESKERTPLE